MTTAISGTTGSDAALGSMTGEQDFELREKELINNATLWQMEIEEKSRESKRQFLVECAKGEVPEVSNSAKALLTQMLSKVDPADFM